MVRGSSTYERKFNSNPLAVQTFDDPFQTGTLQSALYAGFALFALGIISSHVGHEITTLVNSYLGHLQDAIVPLIGTHIPTDLIYRQMVDGSIQYAINRLVDMLKTKTLNQITKDAQKIAKEIDVDLQVLLIAIGILRTDRFSPFRMPFSR
jgi:hypothetical protein